MVQRSERGSIDFSETDVEAVGGGDESLAEDLVVVFGLIGSVGTTFGLESGSFTLDAFSVYRE